jgi:hypothetical protein
MSALNVAGRKNLNFCEISLEQMLMNLSIQEKKTSAPKPHSLSVKQTAISAFQGCNFAPYTFDMTHINGGHNDIAVDFNTCSSQKQHDSTNADLRPELKNVLANCQPSDNKYEVSNALSVEVCEDTWTCKETSNSLEDELFIQKKDNTLPSCHVIKEPYWQHQNSNNPSSAEEIYEPLMNSGSSYNSNSIARPKILESSNEMSLNAYTLQANVEVSLHDQYSVTVHSTKIKQEVISADEGGFENLAVKRETSLHSIGTACISYNLRSRNTNKGAPKLSSSIRGNRNSYTLSLNPIQYSDSSGVPGVKQKMTKTDDNLYLEFSSVKEETDDISTSWKSYSVQSGNDEKACVSNQHSDNSKDTHVKHEILSTFAGNLDFEDSKEEMLPISNVSCISYNLRSRKNQGSSSELVCSEHKDNVRGISISDSGANPVAGVLVKEPSICEIIPTGSYSLHSRKRYKEMRDSSVNVKIKEEDGNTKKCKKLKYYKKRSCCNLQPRNAHKKVTHSGTQIENQALIVNADMCCGTCSLQPRNRLGGGSSHKENKRICFSGLHGKHKPANVDDRLVKQTPECDLNILSRSTSSHVKFDLCNYSPNSYDGVQVKQGILTDRDCSEVENEILNSSLNVSHETCSLRPRKNEGSYSKPASLQHKEQTIICASLGHKCKSSSAEDGKVKQETPLSAVSFSGSYSLHSHIWHQEAGDICGNLNVKEEIDNDKKDELKCFKERSAYYLRSHCRNASCKCSESKLHRNIDQKSEENTTPTISINCSQLHGQRQNVKRNASDMHMTKGVMSSEKNISYHLRSRCVVKQILDQDFPFRKEIKKKKDCNAKNAVIEKLKIMPGFLSDSETASFDSTKNMDIRLGQQVVGKSENGAHNINNPVDIREVQKLGIIPIMDDNKFVKFDCSKELACKEPEQEVDAKCVDRIVTIQERCASGINENNLNEMVCLTSGRLTATAEQKNVGNQKHFTFHDESHKQESLQNCRFHKSFLDWEELGVFGNEKNEETECFVSTTKALHPPRLTSSLQSCEKSNTGTREIFCKMACAPSGHRGSQNNSLMISENCHIDRVEHPYIHNKEIDDLGLKMDVQAHDTLGAVDNSCAGGENVHNQDLFVSELRGDLSWDENSAEIAGTLQSTEEFPYSKSTLMQNMNSTWQIKITDSNGSVHNEQLILASNADMTREQKLTSIDSTDIGKEKNPIGDAYHSQSVGGLVRSFLNVGNLSKGEEIHETHYTSVAEDFDVSGPNSIETSVPGKCGGGGEKLDTCVSTEMILPGICDALTADDFSVDGANTAKISAPEKSLFAEDEKVADSIGSGDRNDTDIEEMELHIKMPKLSLVDSSLARFVMHSRLK